MGRRSPRRNAERSFRAAHPTEAFERPLREMGGEGVAREETPIKGERTLYFALRTPSAARARRVDCKSYRTGYPLHPRAVPQRRAATDATHDRLFLRRRLRTVDLPDPVVAARSATRSAARGSRRPVHTGVQAAPRPFLSAPHQARAQRVAFDVAQHPRQRLLALDDEALEPTLVYVAGAGLSVRALPRGRVSQ